MKLDLSAATPEPAPKPSEHPDVADMVKQDVLLLTGHGGVAEDVAARKLMGMEKYGTPLRPCNGRNAAMDLYQELVDAANYLRQLIYEKTARGTYIGEELVELREDYLRILRMMVKYRGEAWKESREGKRT